MNISKENNVTKEKKVEFLIDINQELNFFLLIDPSPCILK